MKTTNKNSFLIAALHRKADAKIAMQQARKNADIAFNESCVTLELAIKSADQAAIDKAYSEMNQALNRCNELGLF